MKWSKKIKAGALQFVLFIGAIIAVLLMTFLLITYTHGLLDKKTDLTVGIIQETDFGLNYVFKKNVKAGSSIVLNSLNNPGVSTLVEKDFWGIFEKYSSHSKNNAIKYSKIAMVGSCFSLGKPALVLRDKQRPLIIAGTTKITGDALLPAQGVKIGTIAGNSYGYGQLVYGKEGKSGLEIPKLDPEVKQQIDNLINKFQNSGVEVTLRPNMEITNSFGSPTKFIRDKTIHLEGVHLTGNIIVSAVQRIVVEPTAILTDIVLVAPEIIIMDGTQGSFQAIANKKIFIGKNCELYYPSAFVVRENKSTNSDIKFVEPKLFVDSNSIINGVLMYLDEYEKPTYGPQIKIVENAIIKGEIYCTENLELKGSVFGSVITDAFIAMENGSIYQNHLYNGVINSTLLPIEYNGIVFENVQYKKAMKWLY